MKPQNLFLAACMLLTLTFTSCDKKTDPPPGTNPPNQPNQPNPPGTNPPNPPSAVPIPAQPTRKLLSVLERHEKSGGGFETYTTGFFYDPQNRLTERRDMATNLPIARYEYENDQLKRIHLYNMLGNIGATFEDPLVISDDGNTWEVRYAISNGNGGYDTSREVYTFANNAISRIEYIYPSTDPSIPSTQTNIFTYDANGNLSESSFNDGVNNRLLWRVTGVDNQKNILRDISKLVFIFGNIFEYGGMGVNNATSALTGNGQNLAFEWTYNSEGYPLSVKNTSESYVKYEFTW
jgi:hypothetical protein